MSLVVMKFGGTSVGSAERIRQAASIVKGHSELGTPVVVVVSALSKVTDLILSILNAARTGDGPKMEAGLSQLQQRHHEVISELFQGKTQSTVTVEVEATQKRLRELSSALLLLGSATAQVMDMALPLGEQMSARIFAACLNQLDAPGILAGAR